MGGGTGIPFKEYSAIEKLQRHPNYRKSIPKNGETKTQFILRAVAELLSPPQGALESYELECITAATAVKMMDSDLERTWEDYNKNKKNNENSRRNIKR
jgi:hypothetical protein